MIKHFTSSISYSKTCLLFGSCLFCLTMGSAEGYLQQDLAWMANKTDNSIVLTLQ